MDETRKANGKISSTPEPESPVKCNETEDDLPNLDSSPLSNGGEKNVPNTSIGGIKLTMKSGRSVSMKEKPRKESDFMRSERLSLRFGSGIGRSSIRFPWGRPEQSNHAGETKSSVPEENQEFGKGQDCVKKEPLSVMQINELIQERQLLEAFGSIHDWETELLAERDSKKHENNSQEYMVKAKDVDLLYASISKKIQDIVEETLDAPKKDTKALTAMVTLIEKEEEIHFEAANVAASSEPVSRLGTARNWRKFWKETVEESVKERVFKVPIPLKEGNSSWLSIHLGYLKTVTKEDLLTIKHWVQKYYTSDYNVFDTYMKAFHRALSLQLQSILQDALKYHEYHAVLNWITNVYRSDDFLGHPDLQPEIKVEDLPDLLTPEVLEKLNNDYIHSVKLQIKNCLDNILNLERKEKWNIEEQPESVPNQCCSSLSLDIQTLIGEYTKISGNICKNLEMEVLKISLQEMKEFLPRFGNAFLECDKVKDRPQFVPLIVAYVNNFHDLKTGLQTNFNVDHKDLEILTGLMLKYKDCFFNKLKLETKPMFKKILSRAWISTSKSPDSFIKKILLVVEDFSKHLIQLKEPFQKDFLNEAHRLVIKAYITQILNTRRNMRETKRKEVSKIMEKEAATIDQTMTVLGSDSEWLSLAIPYIARIIGEKKKPVIKEYIQDLCQSYPDIGKEHIIAILALRGLRRRKGEFIADHMDGPSESHKRLFAEIELPNAVQCF